jgi:hypothetical protein
VFVVFLSNLYRILGKVVDTVRYKLTLILRSVHTVTTHVYVAYPEGYIIIDVHYGKVL